MALKPIDEQHFYIDDHLIDMAWIGHQVKKQITAANYHDIQRHLGWLNHLASRLLTANIDEQDEAMAKKRLSALGYGWYFEEA